MEHTRVVYCIQDLLGDVGGIIEILYLILGIVINPFSSICLQLKALSQLYLVKTENMNLFSTSKKILADDQIV